MTLTNNEKQVLKNLGFKIREYSGRHMYGKTTDAIVVDSKSTVIEAILENVDGFDGFDGIKKLMIKISKAREDNMGKSDIIIY